MREAGRVRLSPSACLDGAGGECGDYMNYRFSVDCFGAGGYINTRALIGFSFRCFLARACCAGGSMVLRPHRSRHRPHELVPPGYDGSDFFLPILITSNLPAACLRVRFLLPGCSHIHIAPPLAPLISTRWAGRSWMRYGWRVAGYPACLVRAAMDGDGGRRGRRCHACLISLVRCHPSHEMMKRRDTMSGNVLSHSSPDPLSPVLVGLLALNNPPAPGRRRSRRR